MDFRKVGLAALRWGASWYRGQPLARLGDSKVIVQTPMAPCRVSFAGGGMHRVELALVPGVKAHDQFWAWVSAVEASAAASPDLADWRGERSLSASIFRGSMRLMVFSDTLAFDASGALSGDLIGAAACSCLIELQGCWKTDGKWGVRWKVQQIKFDATPPDFPAAAALPVPPPAAADHAAYSFLEDAA